MEHAFIADIHTWGIGGEQADVVVLKNGTIVVVTHTSVVVYDNAEAFESGAPRIAFDRETGAAG